MNTGPTPIPPNAPISITLEAQEWNAVIGLLQEGPYRLVAPLIAKLGNQAQVAAQALAAQIGPPLNGAVPNGQDEPRFLPDTPVRARTHDG
jgi:hypothetical protein